MAQRERELMMLRKMAEKGVLDEEQRQVNKFEDEGEDASAGA